MKTVFSNRLQQVMPNRILALDGVRGIAILGVLLCHGLCPIKTESSWAHALKALFSFGTFGVDLFFVLSGFLITQILLKNHESSNLLKVFWIRRIARIMPLYLAFLAVMFAICAFFITENMPAVPGWAYLFYLQNFYLAAGASPSHFGFDITWSLVIEEHFYLIFPFLIAFAPRKYHLRIILTACCMGLPMRLLVHPWLGNHFHLVQLNSLFLTGRIDELSGGALLAYLIQTRDLLSRRLFSPVCVVVAWAFVGGLYALKTGDHFITAVAGVLTIGTLLGKSWTVCSKLFESHVLRFFGRISYALYLFHSPVFWYFHHAFTGAAALCGVLLAAGVAITLAWISTCWFEEPLLEKARQFRYKKASREACADTDKISY
jgi:peptidoglycan/LPS O-acetylase OafA/YrhL